MMQRAQDTIDLRYLAQRTIVLCGFMGVGKSSAGKKVARRLGRAFYDLDHVVVERLGRSIPELFEVGDESLFRETEAAILAELLEKSSPSVIALGGGAFESASSRALLRQRAFVIHLDQGWQDLYPALDALRESRPLMMNRSNEEIEALYRRRRATYLLADLTIPVARAGVAALTRTILHALSAYVATVSN